MPRAKKPRKDHKGQNGEGEEGGRKLRRPLRCERATVLSSEVVYQGPLFRVLHDKLVEPGGRRTSAM